MKKYLGVAALVLVCATPAFAQISSSSDSASGSRVSRPAPPAPPLSPAAASSMAKQRIEDDKKAGKIPDRNTLQILLSAQNTLKDQEGMATTLEELVADYNDPADWTLMIDTTFGMSGLRDQDAIWLGRLMFVVGAPVSPNDASMVGAISSQLAFLGDAVNAKAHGGSVDPDPGPRAESDKKTMPDQIAAEQAQNGAYNAKLAEALYGYGMYPQAEAAAKLAIQKGDNPDASEAPMILGQALTQQGKYDDAVAAFAQIKGGGATTARIARLWSIYAKIKKNPPQGSAH